MAAETRPTRSLLPSAATALPDGSGPPSLTRNDTSYNDPFSRTNCSFKKDFIRLSAKSMTNSDRVRSEMPRWLFHSEAMRETRLRDCNRSTAVKGGSAFSDSFDFFIFFSFLGSGASASDGLGGKGAMMSLF